MTNLEKAIEMFKEEHPESEIGEIAICTRYTNIWAEGCAEYHFCTLANWNCTYVRPITLTGFEYDLLKCVEPRSHFQESPFLLKMQHLGYFQDIQGHKMIQAILDECKVVDEKETI